ncbi:leucine-rich repeat and IQ domain-containing protein 1 [Ochotona princeps]|uniref:leucine-rich repeat and IQ domain-containing protein 1 n=1 Tax=Ochotona princeps TaxID=9978 RepID=UPI00271551B5|nr:leucine-rich repeat and IQ domain-containing protein 1 [Ochotona princeps]
MMEDDEDANLQEEIEAELDKISISSLEKGDVESEPESEAESGESDQDLDELPESVAYCINVIKNKSKTAEQLILQDLEESDVLSCSYGGVSNNHSYLKIGFSTENKDNAAQLMKILSEIEKEEFMRSKTQSATPDSVVGDLAHPHPHGLPMDVQTAQDDADVSFGYYEVEERCRRSFEAWQDKQKELEDKEKEVLKTQREKEEKQFQEEEEKRHCWMKQFEIEKKKLEHIQKEELDKMHDELHKEEKVWEEKLQQHEEFIRSLHLQMDKERTRLKDLHEKEKTRLLKLQHDAATKIQAKYKAFVAYQNYNPIIKDQLEARKRKAQEWKEVEAKIRQREAERRKQLEGKDRLEEEIKKQKQEEKERREREYEEKKNILRREREELRTKEKLRLAEDAKEQSICSTLKKEEYNVKYLTAEGQSSQRETTSKTVDGTLKLEDVPPWPVEESNKAKNVDTQLASKELIQEPLKQPVSNQETLVELTIEGKSTNLAKKQCSEKLARQEREHTHTDKRTELENPNLKENEQDQFQRLELNSQMQKGKIVSYDINKNVGDKIQAIIVGHNVEINEVKNKEAQTTIEGDQKREREVKNEEIPKDTESIHKEINTSLISVKQKLPPLKLEKSGDRRKTCIIQEKETDLKSKEIEENPNNTSLNNDVIFNTDDVIHTEVRTNKQGFISQRHTPCEDLHGNDTRSSLVSAEVNCLKSDIKPIPEACCENTAQYETVITNSIPGSALLFHIEEKRLAWVKSSKPWFEIFNQNQQKKTVTRRRPVKCPANTMPPLNTAEILQGGPWSTLQQVATVTFQDLPGCSLSPLAECTNLRFLSLRCCGLTSLHSLGNCRKLKYIDVQENHIEMINCENLDNLCVLLLNRNQLTSLHGLDGCTNIQNLELSHNKITRIGGLGSLKNLQQLIVDHNQLISTKGLCDTPTIIYLDCSYNHLTDVEGLENCGLLQILNLRGNYLSELPPLDNHVLLRELHLDDNSISTVEAFSSYWLPLLQKLTISQNSLTKFAPLFHLVSLAKLDFSNNCLSDLTSAIKSLEACYSLRELSLTGNPLLQEINWRHSVLKVLPSLRILNGDLLSCYTENHPQDKRELQLWCFLALCQSQIEQFNLLNQSHNTEKGNVLTLDAAESLCHYFKKLMTLSTEYRFAHEHGDLNITQRETTEDLQSHLAPSHSDSTLQNTAPCSCAGKHESDAHDISVRWMNSDSSHSIISISSICEDMARRNQEELVGRKREDSEPSNIPTERGPFTETVTAHSLLTNRQDRMHSEKNLAAAVIQAHWRGYIMRKKIKFSTKFHTATTALLPSSYIKNQTVLKKEKRKNTVDTQEQRKKAAILIQAVWKGFIFRKKLTAALEVIRNEDSEEEYEEIDLQDFAFDEASLEKEWLVLDSTPFPSQTLLLSNQLPWPKISENLKYDDTSLHLQSHPAQAWLYNEKENVLSSEHTLLGTRSENRTLTWTPESKTSQKSLLKSEREEKISEEWGFKNIATAQQMLKRAQKMKSKKLKKKLDPALHLTLFRNNENKVFATKSPKKAQPRRDGYFEGKEDNSIYRDATENEKLEKREYTYQWLHSQVGVHETRSRNMKCNRFLPELDPDVLNGGRVQLIARLVSREDTDLDLFSMTSGSALSVNREKKSRAHRHSAESSSKLWFPSELI